MSYCPECGTFVPDGGLFCPECGYALGEDMPTGCREERSSLNGGLDVDRRLEQLREQMKNRLGEMQHRVAAMKQIATTKPDSQMDSSILLHHDNLEEDSATKIGTFERLYQAYESADKEHVVIFGYEDDDFAPMVNLLACVIEIELSASLDARMSKDLGIYVDCHQKTLGHYITNLFS